MMKLSGPHDPSYTFKGTIIITSKLRCLVSNGLLMVVYLEDKTTLA